MADCFDEGSRGQDTGLLAAIVRSSPDGIVSVRPDGLITSWNPGAERLFGHPAEDVVGRHVELFWPAHRRAAGSEVLARLSRGESVDGYRTVFRHRDGTEIPGTVSASPITDATGTVVGVGAVFRPMTADERSRLQYAALAEAAPDAVVGVDADGVIVVANAATERLFGYPREELHGQPVEVLVPEVARSVHAKHRDEYRAERHPLPTDHGRQLSGRRRDGTEFPADITLNAVDTDDGMLVAAAVRDATERLAAQAERDRRQAQAEQQRLDGRMQQAQRLESLGQLAGGVAHDFNNLLAVIVNYSAFVSEEIETAATADPDRWHSVARDMQQIQRATDRGIALTHQLLAFGRREVVRPRVLSLNAVVADVQELLVRAIGEHVQLVTEPARGLWPIKADAGQIEQVLVNLAVNARDAMPGGGRLTIETENVVTGGGSGVPGARYVQLRVSDTGTGMPQDVIAHAFEPFFTTKPKGEGTGLGLATVYGIVKQAGGDVRISSVAGEGTAFSVLFPATDEAPVEVEAPVVRVPSGGGETVLVVEDEPAISEVIRRILGRNGYEVLMSGSPLDAVERAGRHEGEIHLLLTDVVMPKMLGKDVAERVRALRPGCKVLYMSGYARPVLASSGTLAPGVTLLEKPFSESVLLAAVRQVLDAN